MHRSRARIALGLSASLLVCLAGCLSLPSTFRSNEKDNAEKTLELPTIGDVTVVGNTDVLQVSGVGLVTGLMGTGDAPRGSFREMLENDMRKARIEGIKGILDSPDNAVVLVSALIPVGARKGDRIDIEVTLPPGSKATSLRGGYLHHCTLRNYDTTKNLKPDFQGGNRMLPGHVLAKAKGPLLVGLGNPDEPLELKRARVWDGGITFVDRPFYFVMKNEDRSARVANAVAQRMNLMFQEDSHRIERVREHLRTMDAVTQQLNAKFHPAGTIGTDVAEALNKELIAVRVPYAYRLNPERYLRVARLTPLRDDPTELAAYRQRLEAMLFDPAETIRAAHRLEALGRSSQPIFKKGLKSEHRLVRFASAESLAYLGSTAGVEILQEYARQHPPVRAYALLALANLDESTCREKLSQLVTDRDAAVRCGAYWSLRTLEDADYLHREVTVRTSRLGGELLNNSFWMHKVATGASPLIYFSLAERAEVVLFGKEQKLNVPIRILAGPEFTVTAAPGDDRCTVSRIQAHEGISRLQCRLDVEEVIRAMAKLGAQYSEVIEFLRIADDRGCLACPLAFNVLPRPEPIETLVEGGRDPNFLSDTYLATPIAEPVAPQMAPQAPQAVRRTYPTRLDPQP